MTTIYIRMSDSQGVKGLLKKHWTRALVVMGTLAMVCAVIALRVRQAAGVSQ